jgi:hypothetical protein
VSKGLFSVVDDFWDYGTSSLRKGQAHLVEGLHPVWTVEAPPSLGTSGIVSRPAEAQRPGGEAVRL